MNQQNQKQSKPDNAVADASKDLVATAGQSQQSGKQQQGSQQQGNQQQGNQQQGGGQHASGGTPALDDLDGQKRGESARDASDAFQQQDQQRGNR